MLLIASLWFAAAAVFALVGTNAQARLSKQRLLADTDPLIAEAGRLWSPRPRLLSQRPATRRRRAAVEQEVRQDPERAKRYDRLRAELSAWNTLETSVALAAVASVLAVIAVLTD